jgi:pimeloyl-ACP methyl ester carboxylesterase
MSDVITTPLGPVEMLQFGDGADLLLLLHATAGKSSLSRVAEWLQRPERRILVPAFHGYGASALDGGLDGGGGRPVAELNRLLAGYVLEAAGPARRRVVFGHSMGGQTGLLAALDAEDAGRPFDAVVLYEPILHGLLDPARAAEKAALDWDREIVEALAAADTPEAVEAGVARFVEAWNETNWHDIPPAARAEMVAGAARLVAETTSMPALGPAPERLASMRAPVLFLRGDRSPAFCGLVAANGAAAAPNGTSLLLPGCGHMAPAFSPAPVATAVDDFLALHGL